MKFADFLLTEKQAVDDYKGEHSAPTKDDAPLHDLTGNGVYPDDVYDKPKYYVSSDTEQECYNIAVACKGRPNKLVRMYRAVPIGEKKAIEKELAQHEKNKAAYQKRAKLPSDYAGNKKDYYDYVSDKIDELSDKLESMEDDSKIKINAGDWVTLSRAYAVDHGEGHLKGKYKILSKAVPAKELHTDGNSLAEWGWNP